MEVHLLKLIQKNAESKKHLCILVLDIDHFKKINDTYGHGVGDEVLKTIAFRLKDSLRSFDLVARLGGEEFVAILPDTNEEMSQFVAERLRRSIGERPIKCAAPQGEITVTTSIGGAYIEPGAHTVQAVIDRADKALYVAKESGRNCTVFEKWGKLEPDQFRQEPRPIIQ